MEINPKYFFSTCRDVDVSHKTGILRFTSKAEYFMPVGQFISDSPLTPECNSFSFEIVSVGKGCRIAIGVCPEFYLPRRMPGWNFGSYAYHAVDGGIYTGFGWPQSNVVTSTIGDVVKCELDIDNKEILFYKNDKLLCTIYNIPNFGNFHAAVGFHSPGACVRLLEKQPWQTKEAVLPSFLQARRSESSQFLFWNFTSWLMIGFFIAISLVKECFTVQYVNRKCIVKTSTITSYKQTPPTERKRFDQVLSTWENPFKHWFTLLQSARSKKENNASLISSSNSSKDVLNIMKPRRNSLLIDMVLLESWSYLFIKLSKEIRIVNSKYQESVGIIPKIKFSPAAKERGTIEFVKYALDCDDFCPSYWTKGLDGLVDVDARTKDCIEKLITLTFRKDLIGQGKDANGLMYSGIEIMDMKRIQNMKLFQKYNAARRELLQKTVESNELCQDIALITDSVGGVLTTKHLCDLMKQELITEINEHYLFHGTREHLVETLTNRGLDCRTSSAKCMYGKGIYMAESFTKADQYTDSDEQRSPNGTELYMLLIRAQLGNVCRFKDAKNGLCRPPCKHCSKDKCICDKQDLYDSVMRDKKEKFREFVLYDNSQCYPEYLIIYKRL
ncbi:hypothetical protein Btru_019890 [Bulinus truncatus]|nr:hypothetical protein Btru_019890 [Bulinus truncatus]